MQAPSNVQTQLALSSPQRNQSVRANINRIQKGFHHRVTTLEELDGKAVSSEERKRYIERLKERQLQQDELQTISLDKPPSADVVLANFQQDIQNNPERQMAPPVPSERKKEAPVRAPSNPRGSADAKGSQLLLPRSQVSQHKRADQGISVTRCVPQPEAEIQIGESRPNVPAPEPKPVKVAAGLSAVEQREQTVQTSILAKSPLIQPTRVQPPKQTTPLQANVCKCCEASAQAQPPTCNPSLPAEQPKTKTALNAAEIIERAWRVLDQCSKDPVSPLRRAALDKPLTTQQKIDEFRTMQGASQIISQNATKPAGTRDAIPPQPQSNPKPQVVQNATVSTQETTRKQVVTIQDQTQSRHRSEEVNRLLAGLGNTKSVENPAPSSATRSRSAAAIQAAQDAMARSKKLQEMATEEALNAGKIVREDAALRQMELEVEEQALRTRRDAARPQATGLPDMEERRRTLNQRKAKFAELLRVSSTQGKLMDDDLVISGILEEADSIIKRFKLGIPIK